MGQPRVRIENDGKGKHHSYSATAELNDLGHELTGYGEDADDARDSLRVLLEVQQRRLAILLAEVKGAGDGTAE